MCKKFYPLSLFLLAGSLFAASPFVGTWKLDIAKSKFAPQNPAPKEETLVIEEVSDQYSVTGRGTAADGSPFSQKFTVPKTGGPAQYPEGGLAPGYSVVFAKTKADSRIADSTTTKDGKVVITTHYVVSADGKSFRDIDTSTDPQGKKSESVAVWVKQ
jgi:hypothetical protein